MISKLQKHTFHYFLLNIYNKYFSIIFDWNIFFYYNLQLFHIKITIF